MPVSSKNLSFMWFISFSILVLFPLGEPSLAETPISETPLAADILVEQEFQAGGGLPVGKILAARGDVFVYHRDLRVAYPIETGLPLYHGDTIQTQATGRILGRLIEGTLFSLAPDTTLTIVQCNTNAAANTSLSFLSLTKGAGRFQVKPPSEIFSHDFKVETTTAFAQARNADFFIRTDEDTTTFMTSAGSRLEATNLAAAEEIFFLSDFQKTVVTDRPDPQLIVSVTEEEYKSATTETRLPPSNRLFASSPEHYSEPAPVSDAQTLESDRQNAD